MKLNRIILVSILLLIFAVGAVSATDENITDTADDVLSAEPTNEVLAAEPTEELEVTQPEDFSELVTLIKGTSSGKTLTLEKDYINDGTYTKGILISKKMTIDGQGHTLDANGKSNIFRISNNQVTLKNINFINSTSKEYSAVYGNCTVINCTFTDCTTEYYGGALYNGTAYDSSFIRCVAYSWDDGRSYINYCKGGAIYQGDAYNCSFVGCSAIYLSGDDEVDGDGDGGAIYKGNAYDCSFTNCYSGYQGGAICYGNAYNSSFEKCSGLSIGWGVGFGGAIYHGDAYNCSFVSCNAYLGGAIGSGNAYNSSFIGCYAYEGQTLPGSGGAIGRGNAYNCYFEECSAGKGGAINVGNATDCSFVDCKSISGSAIYSGNAQNCSFVECSNGKYGYGGVIYMGNVSDSIFINCTSSKKDMIINGKHTNCIFLPDSLLGSNLTVNYGEGKVLQIRTVKGSDNLPVNVKIYKDGKLINSFPTTTGSDLPIDAAPGNYIIALTCEHTDPLNISLVVNKGSPKLALTNDFAKSGETANVKVSISKKATGFVKIIINGETYRVQINNGVASAEVPNLADGNYNVKVTYAGNAYHTAETITDTFQVGKTNQGIKLTTKNIKVGETERLTATLAKDATGFVRFLIGEDTYKVKIENETASVDINNLKAGTYSVTLKYAGNYRYNAESISKTFTVSKSSPEMTITANNIIVGDTTTIKVNIASDAPGNILITVNGESQKVPIQNGMATLTLSNLKLGTYDVSAKYAGNYKYDAQTVTKTFTVSKTSPKMTIISNNINPGDSTTIRVTIAKDAPGNILITVNGESQKVPIQNGEARLTLSNLTAGTYDVSAKYAGNYRYNAQTVTKTFAVTKLSPKITIKVNGLTEKNIGDQVSITKNVTITADLAGDVSGNVLISVKGESYNVSINNSRATLNLSPFNYGKYNITVEYAGNYRYNAETKTISFSVYKLLATPISISAKTDDGKTMITTKVNPEMTGNIKITYEGTTYTANIVNSEATVTIDGVIPGSHKIEIKYSGDEKFNRRTLTKTITI